MRFDKPGQQGSSKSPYARSGEHFSRLSDKSKERLREMIHLTNDVKGLDRLYG